MPSKSPKRKRKKTTSIKQKSIAVGRKRNEKGQLLAPGKPKTTMELWNEPGALGFAYFIHDTRPHILNSRNQYEPFKATKKQIEIIKKVLAVSEQGNFLHSLHLLIWPRRHSKSTLFALIVLWLFFSRKNLTIQLNGNNEIHSRRVQFNLLLKIIRNTPDLKRRLTERDFYTHRIENLKRGNVIQMNPASTATSFGDKIDVLWVSDLHACVDLSPFNALQASLLDSDNSLCLIDSNVDTLDGHIHSLQKESKEDDSIFCDHIEYKDLEDFKERAPTWINRAKAKRLQSTSLPADFSRDVLGKRLDAQNALFPSEIIELCKSPYQIPITDISELTKGRAYKIGAGLDRSKSLFGGDNTVWTVILKVASPEHGEPEFFLLNQEVIIPNTSRMIKKAILKDHEKYNLDSVTLENYEVVDLSGWLSDQGIPFELVSAHNTNQNISFTEFYRVAKEGRFHFPKSLKGLSKEMSTFVYTQKTGGVYSFGHVQQKKLHDDRVYSVNWSIFSLRDVVMNLYTLGNIA